MFAWIAEYALATGISVPPLDSETKIAELASIS